MLIQVNEENGLNREKSATTLQKWWRRKSFNRSVQQRVTNCKEMMSTTQKYETINHSWLCYQLMEYLFQQT